jgi:hypothetical protein
VSVPPVIVPTAGKATCLMPDSPSLAVAVTVKLPAALGP